MAEPLIEMLSAARAWCTAARAEGWLDELDTAPLDQVEQSTPADLFADQQARPLVVALFGGTGVGKSSLLNRLAGRTIAQTGEERPTSREVTLYVHADIALAELPASLPLDAVQIERHRADPQREVLWIDAPDIDSTEEANRKRALAWLPHVDLVCYVVSPERYRDDAGWQQVLARGHAHGWMFVINRWDEGDPRQRADFARILRDAGFEQPVLFCTCCVPGRSLPSADEFEQIDQTLQSLLAAHGVRELTRLGHRARLQALRSALVPMQARLGDEEAWRRVRGHAESRWQAVSQTVMEGAEWSLRALAGRFAARDGGWEKTVQSILPWSRPAGEEASADAANETLAELDTLAGQIWDHWAEGKLGGWLDSVEVELRRLEVAALPVRQGLDVVAARAGPRVATAVADHLRWALARPGQLWMRALRRVTGFLMGFLPPLALLWVAWAVVRSYGQAAQGSIPFLGVPFAIHSAMLVLISWAVPYTLDRLLRPSLERLALQAMRQGLEEGLDQVGKRLLAELHEREASAARQRSAARRILERVSELMMKPVAAQSPVLGRMLARRIGSVPTS